MIVHAITKAVVKTFAQKAGEAFATTLITVAAPQIATKAVDAAAARIEEKRDKK